MTRKRSNGTHFADGRARNIYRFFSVTRSPRENQGEGEEKHIMAFNENCFFNIHPRKKSVGSSEKLMGRK